MQTHACRTRIGPQRCCQSMDYIWHLSNTKNRRLFWFSEKNRNRGKKITWGQSEKSLHFVPKIDPQKTTQKQLCMEFLKLKAERGWSTRSMPSAVVFNGKVCLQVSKVPDVLKFMGSERLHPSVPSKPATVDTRKAFNPLWRATIIEGGPKWPKKKKKK